MKSKRELGIKTPKAPRRKSCGCWYFQGEIKIYCSEHFPTSPMVPTIKEDKESQLPKRKWNSPISYIVCWRCKNNDQPLRKLKDSEGKKSKDYACNNCWMLGSPAIGNQSQIYYQYEKEN